MAYDEDSIARSVRRYVFAVLDEAWTIDLQRDEVKDDARPAGVVEMGEARLREGRSAIPQGNVTRFAPVTVTLYPVVQDPRKAGRAARKLSTLMNDLIVFGLDLRNPDTGRLVAGPERIPLYDYDAVDYDADPPVIEGPDLPHDVLWAEDYSSNAIQDPLDPRRWSVVLEMRVSWEQPGRTVPDAPLATGGLVASYRGLVRPGPVYGA